MKKEKKQNVDYGGIIRNFELYGRARPLKQFCGVSDSI